MIVRWVGIGGLLAQALLTILLVAAPLAGAVPTRIASLNLCTDSMLLELAPIEHVVSVTHLAQDPALAPFAARARDLTLNHGLAEELIELAPDLILSGGSTSATTADLLKRLGYRVERFPEARSLAEFRREFLRLGRLLARETEGRRLLDTMTKRLAAALPPSARTESALLISGNGFVPGPETLADDLLAHAGLSNAAADFGLSHGGFLTLEQLLLKPPRWLVVGTTGPSTPALAEEYLHHPALRQSMPDGRHIIPVPESLWACGGTYFADAVVMLTRELSRARSDLR